ncbi:MAG TPA: hypothetical protein VMW91_06040 [Desulfosporosinus sp.]|nr:hypothetical protein [Desulfosporosinus sp.]
MQWSKNRSLKKIFVIILIEGIFILGSGIIPNVSQTQNIFAQTIHPCLNRVGVPISELRWLYIPEYEYELNTEEQYFFLAGQLISNNVVDASICPLGGLIHNGYANACGMATALPTVIKVQNMLNEPILQAWKEVGVPPVLLKQLIRIESQFWPSMYTNGENNDVYEYGFGHITHMGMQNALQWNRDLYKKVCSVSDSVNCVWDSGMVNQILLSLVSTCSNCENGINPNLMNRSVDILAETVLGYCYQTEQLIFNATDWHPSLVVDYATIWKLTLMNYTSGPQCVLDTIESTFEMTDGPMDWFEISANVPSGNCKYGLEFADRITAKYFDFPPKK